MFIRDPGALGNGREDTLFQRFPEVNDWETTEDAVPELEFMKGIQNYVSVIDQPEEAEIEIDRYKEKGFVRDISWEDVSQRFGCGTVSKLALIIKSKPDLSIKRRIVISQTLQEQRSV